MVQQSNKNMNDELNKFKQIKDATTTCLNIDLRFQNQICNLKVKSLIIGFLTVLS